MPRQARIDAPGALHHVIVRGIERRKIFKDNIDRRDFLTRLGKVLSETNTRCFAWALVPNHFHLLLRSGNRSLATVMRRLLTGYAMGFNRRHRRSGQLFQNRYKSILCQEDKLAEKACALYGLDPEQIFMPGKQPLKVKAQSMFCYCVRRGEQIVQKEVHDILGKKKIII